MLKFANTSVVDLASPLVGLVVERRSLLGRRRLRLWNRDNALRNTATSLLIEKYQIENNVDLSAFGEEEEESGLIRFLNWLIDNQDTIRALIEMIMGLFNKTELTNNKKDNDVI